MTIISIRAGYIGERSRASPKQGPILCWTEGPPLAARLCGPDLTFVKALSGGTHHFVVRRPETSMSRTLHVVCPHCDTINRVPSERLHQAGKCGACHRPLFERRPVELNNLARFEKHLNNSDIPLLVDFWAAWCGPCRAMAPILEQAATDLEPNVRVLKVDSEAVPELTRRFFIQSIPTLLIVHRGHEIARTSGLMPLPRLLAWVRQHTKVVETRQSA